MEPPLFSFSQQFPGALGTALAARLALVPGPGRGWGVGGGVLGSDFHFCSLPPNSQDQGKEPSREGLWTPGFGTESPWH